MKGTLTFNFQTLDEGYPAPNTKVMLVHKFGISEVLFINGTFLVPPDYEVPEPRAWAYVAGVDDIVWEGFGDGS